MGRPPCCDKSNVKRGPWTPEEDAKILAYVASHGIGNWTLVPQKAGLNRCGKSCRLRWTNYLRPDLKHDNFTPQEEECILECHKTFGSRWSLIAKRLPGRTDNDVKNYWNTKLKKKLAKMGIDPVTHKPFSQVFTEYGKISCLPIAKNRNPFLQNVTLDDQTILKPENNGARKPETLAQFQAISNQEMVPSCYSSEASFSSAFSSPDGVTRFCLGPSHTCEIPQAQMAPPSLFGHGEYVVSGDDQFPGCKYSGKLSFDNATFPVDKIVDAEKRGSYCDGDRAIYGNCGGVVENATNGESSSSSSAAADSFVEAILAHDSEMRLQFPNILDEDYYGY